MHRRRFLSIASGTAVLPFAPYIARAQAYPARPVRIIVPFAPGGTNDILGRLIGQWLSERLGQTFVVENRPGAGTNIGTEAVVRAPADGYTLLLIGTPSAINATLYEKLNFNFLQDIAPVAGLVRVPNVMVVNPLFPARTVPEFIAYAKANPNKVNQASPGAGSSSHLAGELFKAMTGTQLVHVPYRGNAPALTDLMAGQVHVSFDTMPALIEFVRGGRLRALAVTTLVRSQALPDIATMNDFVPGYESSGFFGVGAPRNTPVEIVDKLNKEINAALVDAKLNAQIAEFGGVILAGSPADFRKLIADETEKWGKVIRTANIRAE